MTDRPILFTAPMVRALLDGRKTQTRRGLSLRGHRSFSQFGPSDTVGYDWHFRDAQMRWHDHRHASLAKLLPCAPGDRLWVRETYAYVGSSDPGWLLRRADDYQAQCDRHGFDKPYPPESAVTWKPSIFMPRRLSRLTLLVTDVRVQRLQDISEADALAEGVPDFGAINAEHREAATRLDWARRQFAILWNSINGPDAWAENPWVAAISFDVVRANIDQVRP